MCVVVPLASVGCDGKRSCVCFVALISFPNVCVLFVCVHSAGPCDANDGSNASEDRCKSPTSGKTDNRFHPLSV